MTPDRRKFIAKQIREENNKVCYEIRIDHGLLCIVWISVKQSATHGNKFSEEWCRRHEESLEIAGIAGVDLSNEIFGVNTRAAKSATRRLGFRRERRLIE